MAAEMLAAISTVKGDSTTLASLESVGAVLQGQTGAKAAAEAVVGLAKKSSGQLLSLLKTAKESLDRDGDTIAGEEGSVRSLEKQDANEHLRVCPSCLAFLGRREAQMEQCNPPAFVSQFDQLQLLLTEIANVAPSYTRTAESLRNGETMYTLPAAEELRRKMIRKQKEVDTLSKHISDDFDELEIGKDDAKVRKRIRAVALLQLQEHLMGLPPLPTPEEYASLVERRKAEIARQLAESRNRMEEENLRAKGLSSSGMRSSQSTSSLKDKIDSSNRGRTEKISRLPRQTSMLTEGWTPEQVVASNPFVEDDFQEDALVVQRKQVASFLQQAAEAGKLDDAKTLEENLRIIDEELLKMGVDLR